MRVLSSLLREFRRVAGYFATERVSLVPFLREIRKYRLVYFKADLRASMNVSLLAFPQSMAFASIAGLPIVYGILGAAVAGVIAPLFSGSQHTVLGPTNATAFMMFSFFSMHPALADRWVDLVPLMVFLVGLIAFLGAVFRVADLLQYISRSVLVGYISGAAVLIISNQLKPWLGLSPWMDAKAATSFVGLWVELIKTMSHIQWVPAGIGVVTLLFYQLLRKWRPSWPAFALTLLVTSVIFGPLIQYQVGWFAGLETFKTFGFADLKPSFPHFGFSTLFNDVSSLIGVSFALAFLSALENSLMAKTLASRSGSRLDVNQDLLSVGLANLGCSLTGGMVASGSLTRSMLNVESGAKTRFASFYSGLYVFAFAIGIAGMATLGVRLIDYVPKCSLAALIIALSLSLFNWRHIRICLKSTRDDATVLFVTFIAALLAPLYVAIFIGVAVSISLFLRRASRPHLVEYEFSEYGELREMGESHKRPIPAISIVHVEGDLFFGAADLFRAQIQRTVADPTIQVIILRLKNARHLDATSVMALEDLITFMRKKGRHLIVSGASRDVYRVLKKSGVLVTLQEGCDRKQGESNVFLAHPRNPNLSTRGALKRAQQLLGNEKAEIRIFYDPSI